MEGALPYLLYFLIAFFIAILILTPLKRMEGLYRVTFNKIAPVAFALFLIYTLIQLICKPLKAKALYCFHLFRYPCFFGRAGERTGLERRTPQSRNNDLFFTVNDPNIIISKVNSSFEPSSESYYTSHSLFLTDSDLSFIISPKRR